MMQAVDQRIEQAHQDHEIMAEDAQQKLQRGRLEQIADPKELAAAMEEYERDTSLHPDKPQHVDDGTVHQTEADIIMNAARKSIDTAIEEALAGNAKELDQQMEKFSQEAQADVIKNEGKQSLMSRLREARWAKAVYMAAMLFRAASAMDSADPTHSFMGGDDTHHQSHVM